MKLLKGVYQKYIFWSIIGWGGLKAVTEPQSIKLAFSSGNEFLAATFGLIVSGILIGSIIYGISRIFKKKPNVKAEDMNAHENVTQEIATIKPLNIEYYSVSTQKLAILSMCTLGLYIYYWFYKNWKCVRDDGGEKITPFLRAWFLLVTSYGLFKRILLSAQNQGYKNIHSAGLLATAIILITITYKFPDPYWLVALLNFVPLIHVQNAINYNNLKLNPNYEISKNFNWKEVVIAVVGGIILILAIYGTLMPVKDGLVKEYYKSGNLKNESTYNNDILEGVAKGYYETGELEWEQSYLNNKLHGTAKSYYKNGQLEVIMNYHNDKQDGEALEYDKDGLLIARALYKNNVEVYLKEYDEFGNLLTDD